MLLLIQNQRSSTEIILASQINRGSNREDVLAREWLHKECEFYIGQTQNISERHKNKLGHKERCPHR